MVEKQISRELSSIKTIYGVRAHLSLI